MVLSGKVRPLGAEGLVHNSGKVEENASYPPGRKEKEKTVNIFGETQRVPGAGFRRREGGRWQGPCTVIPLESDVPRRSRC